MEKFVSVRYEKVDYTVQPHRISKIHSQTATGTKELFVAPSATTPTSTITTMIAQQFPSG